MADDTPQKRSTVMQSFSHGRKRIVEVERVPARESKPERPVLHLPKKKKKGKKTIPGASALSSDAATSSKQPKKARKTKTQQSEWRDKVRRHAKRWKGTGLSGEVNGLDRSTLKGLSRPGSTLSPGLSAGMPGNEDVDPPQRVSSSTPADRARSILKG